MPRAPHPCCKSGCPGLTTTGRYCDEHKYLDRDDRREEQRAADAVRPASSQRGYDAAWRRARDAKLARDPLCEDCLRRQRIVPAVEVHHVVALRRGGRRLDARNLRSLCRACHRRAEKSGN